MMIGRSVASMLAATVMMLVAPAVKAADVGVEAAPFEAAIPGMVGGFGAASDVTWDVFGVGYQWNEWLSLVAGYRATDVDHEDDGFVYDVVQQGPVLGAVMRF